MDSATSFSNIALRANREDSVQILRDFAEFWKIPYTLRPSPNSQHIVVSSGQIPQTETTSNNSVVMSPAGPEDAKRIAQRFDLGLAIKERVVRLPFSRSAETSLLPLVYEFKGQALEPIIEADGVSLLSRIRSTSIHLLSIDLASEYALRISSGLEDPPSMKFRVASLLPLSYHTIPAFIRNRGFRSDGGLGEIRGEKLGPIECLRSIFLASLVALSEAPVPCIGFWKRGKKYALAVTHDVETKRGLLNGAQQLLGIEEELQIRSTWNIITNRYPLTRESLKVLARSGEIGGHDTRHDGRLILLSSDAKVRRLRSCKERLEELAQTRVRGFRSPLLQHDKELVTAVGKAGYEFDSSVPSWELLSPTSFKPHGVGTVFPFRVGDVLEIPVSLPQDHQLLRVSNLTPSEASNTLIRASNWIREIGGLSILLIHPDYDFALEDYGSEYSRILRSFREDPQCDIMTLGELADWWSLRFNSQLENSNGDLKVMSTAPKERLKDLVLERVTSYGPRGFTVEDLN